MYFINQYTVHIVLYILYASILQIYFDINFFKENYALIEIFGYKNKFMDYYIFFLYIYNFI